MMIKIVICEDEKRFAVKACDDIKRIMEEHGKKCETEIFLSGDNLIDSITQRGFFFDILFMDIDLNGMDGIEIAKTLRAMNGAFVLIYLSHVENQVFESFKTSPLRFIRKDKGEEKLQEELREALQKAVEIKAYESVVVEFKTRTLETGTLKLQDIMYFKTYDRRIHLYTATKEGHIELLTGSILEYEAQYGSEGFVRIGKSHLVNVRYIAGIGAKNIRMQNGVEISLGRDQEKIKKIKKQYYDHIKEGTWQ